MTIYDSYLAMRSSDWLYSAPVILIILGCFVLIVSVFGMWSTKDHIERSAWRIVTFVASCVLLLCSITLAAFTPRYQVYKAVITDITALPEILDKYEIIAQDGQILTLQAWEAHDFSEDKP